MQQLEYLNPEKASEHLRDQGIPVSQSSLARYRRLGGGPTFVRFGPRSVLYVKSNLDAWARARMTARAAEVAA